MNCGPCINLPVTSRSSLDTPPGPVEPPPTSRLGVPRSCSLDSSSQLSIVTTINNSIPLLLPDHEGDCISRICDCQLPLAYSPRSSLLPAQAPSRTISVELAPRSSSQPPDHHLGQALIPWSSSRLDRHLRLPYSGRQAVSRSSLNLRLKLYVSNVKIVSASCSGVCMEALDLPASTILTVTGQPCIPVKHLT